MGYDYDDAEDQYWASNHGLPSMTSYRNNMRRLEALKAERAEMAQNAKNFERAKSYGYTDEEIMSLDEWPWDLSPYARAEQFRKVRLATNTKRATSAAMIRKEETSPLGSTERANEIKREMQMINKSRTIADLKAAILAAQKELALLEKIPNEPGEKLTSFTVTFEGSTKPYIYVGLRIDGSWKVSGRHFANGKYTWSGIFERFEQIHATVNYISTPTEFRHEQVYS